ncbi:MAG: biotin/lipoyl-binding protein [Clostridiaceae bacterium]|nr:biotin/lipoyl-binding protein [Clostridiaceae bacterium]
MRKFVINVNGNRYEVEVEEVTGSGNAIATAAAPVQAAPAEPAQPVQKAAAPEAPKPAVSSSAPEGAVKITAPMPGTILDIKVKTGDQVKKGDVLLILEAMKMENEIVSPQDGVIASVNTSKGASVNSGDLLVSIS